MYGDIELQGKHYRISLPTWKVRDIIDFAPRASVPGGSVIMSDLSLYQPLVQNDWRRGFGFQWYQDAAGYMKTEGSIDTRHEGMAMLFTKSISSDTSNYRKDGFVTFNGKLYAWGENGLRVYENSAWSNHSFSGIEKGEVTQASAASTTSLIYRHTVPSYGQNKLLVVTISLASNVTVSSVTFNGDALTQLSTVGTAPKAEIWYRKEPDTTEGDIVITLGSASAISSGAVSFLYVDQTTTFGTPATSSGTGTSSSVTVTGASGRTNIDVLAKIGGSADGHAAGTDQTQDWVQYVSTTVSGGGSTIDSTASLAMTWSWTTSRAYAAAGVSIIPATQEVTGAVNFALNAGDYLFYCPDGARIRKISTAGSDSVAGLNSSSTDYKWLIIHNGFIYAGKDGTNMVHYSSEPDLSDLEGTADDPAVIYVGLGNTPTLGAVSYAGNLYVPRRDGLWTIGEDAIARKAIDYTNEASDVNFASMAIHSGFLYFPIRNRIVQWNGVRVNDLTPDKLNDTFPFTTYGNFDHFVTVDSMLYMVARTNESPFKEHLICFDGAGWHKLTDLVTGTDYVSAMNFDTENERMWWHKDATADATYYIQFQENSIFPYASFDTAGTHRLYTSLLDMGFRRIKKSMPSMIVETENLSSVRYITIYYQLDGEGDWIFWDYIKTSGTVEITNPGSRKTREFNYIQFRFDFVTDAADQSPILNGYTVRFIMRPDVMFGWNFDILAGTGLKDTYNQDEREAIEVIRELRAIRDSKEPVKFRDVLGDTTWVYLTAMTEIPTYRRPLAEGELDDIEYSINVNLVSMEASDASTT
jgi:hypothetical protein